MGAAEAARSPSPVVLFMAGFYSHGPSGLTDSYSVAGEKKTTRASKCIFTLYENGVSRST